MFNELRNRGVHDVLIAVVDGLKGFPEAIGASFPHTLVQTCIVHLLRNSLAYVPWKDRKAVATALKEIYRAVDATAAEAALSAFESGPWGRKYPSIAPIWRRAWPGDGWNGRHSSRRSTRGRTRCAASSCDISACAGSTRRFGRDALAGAGRAKPWRRKRAGRHHVPVQP